MYLCLCVFEGERKNTERELRSGLRFVGSLGEGLCLFGLGSAQEAASLGPQTTLGLTFANILSSCSGDMLNWERLARVA